MHELLLVCDPRTGSSGSLPHVITWMAIDIQKFCMYGWVVPVWYLFLCMFETVSLSEVMLLTIYKTRPSGVQKGPEII